MLPHISDLEIPDAAGLFIDPAGQFDALFPIFLVVKSGYVFIERAFAFLRQRFEGRTVSLPLGLGGTAREGEDGIVFRSVAHGVHGRAVQKHRESHRQVAVRPVLGIEVDGHPAVAGRVQHALQTEFPVRHRRAVDGLGLPGIGREQHHGLALPGFGNLPGKGVPSVRGAPVARNAARAA